MSRTAGSVPERCAGLVWHSGRFASAEPEHEPADPGEPDAHHKPDDSYQPDAHHKPDEYSKYYDGLTSDRYEPDEPDEPRQ